MRQIIYRVDSETTESGIELRFSPLMNDSQIKNSLMVNDSGEVKRGFTIEELNYRGLVLQSIFPFRDDKNISYQIALFNF